jgi:hypothetical protein
MRRESGRMRAACRASILFVVAAGTGCGHAAKDAPQRAPVMGMVTLDGELLEQGAIRFIPTGGTSGPQTTAVIDRGLFRLPKDFGPVIGRHRVEIQSSDTGGFAMDDEQALERLQAQRPQTPIRIVRVPPVYNERSRLTAQVPPACTGDLNFDLVSSQNLAASHR